MRGEIVRNAWGFLKCVDWALNERKQLIKFIILPTLDSQWICPHYQGEPRGSCRRYLLWSFACFLYGFYTHVSMRAALDRYHGYYPEGFLGIRATYPCRTAVLINATHTRVSILRQYLFFRVMCQNVHLTLTLLSWRTQPSTTWRTGSWSDPPGRTSHNIMACDLGMFSF